MACGFVTLGMPMPLMTHQSNEDEASITPFRGEWWKEAGYSFQPTFGREAPVANPFQSESRDVGFRARFSATDRIYLILHSCPSLLRSQKLAPRVAKKGNLMVLKP